MTVVTVRDEKLDGYLDFDFEKILSVLGKTAKECSWTIATVDTPDDNARRRFDDLLERGKPVASGVLLDAIRECYQLVEATFECRRAVDAEPWVTVRVVDGSEFDIETADGEVVDRAIHAFREVRLYKYEC